MAKDSEDSDPLDYKEKKKPNDLAEMIVAPLTTISLKSTLFLFLIFLFVSSNIFLDQILCNFSDVQHSGQLTNRGIVIQGVFLVLFFMVIQIIIGMELI